MKRSLFLPIWNRFDRIGVLMDFSVHSHSIDTYSVGKIIAKKAIHISMDGFESTRNERTRTA